MLKLEGCYFWKHQLQTSHLVFLPSILSSLWQIHRATSCTIHSHSLALEYLLQRSNIHLGHSAFDEFSFNCRCFSTLIWCLYVELMSSVRFNKLFPLWHFILPFLPLFLSPLFFWKSLPLIPCKDFWPVSLRI